MSTNSNRTENHVLAASKEVRLRCSLDNVSADNHFSDFELQLSKWTDKTGDKPLSDIVKEYIKDKYNKPGNVQSDYIICEYSTAKVVHIRDRDGSLSLWQRQTSQASTESCFGVPVNPFLESDAVWVDFAREPRETDDDRYGRPVPSKSVSQVDSHAQNVCKDADLLHCKVARYVPYDARNSPWAHRFGRLSL